MNSYQISNTGNVREMFADMPTTSTSTSTRTNKGTGASASTGANASTSASTSTSANTSTGTIGTQSDETKYPMQIE